MAGGLRWICVCECVNDGCACFICIHIWHTLCARVQYVFVCPSACQTISQSERTAAMTQRWRISTIPTTRTRTNTYVPETTTSSTAHVLELQGDDDNSRASGGNWEGGGEEVVELDRRLFECRYMAHTLISSTIYLRTCSRVYISVLRACL